MANPRNYSSIVAQPYSYMSTILVHLSEYLCESRNSAPNKNFGYFQSWQTRVIIPPLFAQPYSYMSTILVHLSEYLCESRSSAPNKNFELCQVHKFVSQLTASSEYCTAFCLIFFNSSGDIFTNGQNIITTITIMTQTFSVLTSVVWGSASLMSV